MRLARNDERARGFVLGGWLAVVAATQSWPSWSAAIKQQFAADVSSYQQIAAAAPGLPSVHLPEQHAQRFPVHWLAGTLANATGDVHAAYRVLSLLCLLGTLAAMHRLLVRTGVSLGGYAICTGILVASAYPDRYLLAAPGMLSDAAFLLGLSLALVGVSARGSDVLAVGGLAIATLGRQTAVPLAVAAALVLAHRGRRVAAAGSVAVPVVVYLVERAVASRFSTPEVGGLSSFTVLGSLGHPLRLADHVGRVLLALAVPLGLLCGAWLRTRRRPQLGLTLVAVSVAAQPLVLGPGWVGHNEPRLAALGLPALVVLGASVLGGFELSWQQTLTACAAIFAASLQPRYSDVGIPGNAAWAVLLVLGSVGVTVTVAVGRRAPLTAPDGSAAAPTAP